MTGRGMRRECPRPDRGRGPGQSSLP
jgi:hypothetical protein